MKVMPLTAAKTLLFVLLLAPLLAACVGLGGGQGSQPPVLVESLLTEDEFRASGLEKLDEEEIRVLNLALNRALSGDSASREVDQAALAAWQRSAEEPLATFGLRDEHPNARRHDQMRSRLAREIRDWDRGQRIHLENGQVWEVVNRPTRMFGRPVDNVEVTIRRAAWDSFLMQIEDKHASIRVRRVR